VRRATLFFPRLHATPGFCQLSALYHRCSQLQLQAHPSPRLQPPVHLMERVRSAESHPRLPVKVVRQARVRPVELDRPMAPFLAKYQWLGWDMRFGATECCSTSFLLPPPVVPPCSTPYSFFSCFTSPHVEIPRAWAGPNDGPAASFGLILFRPVDPSPSPPSLSCLLPYSLRYCQYLRQPRSLIPRFSAALYFHAKHPVSEYVVSVSSRVF
jgi:hypothetical protein